jgi:hypothetical protein
MLIGQNLQPEKTQMIERQRWASLRPRPRKPNHEVQGWGIFNRYNGEFSAGVDSLATKFD